MQIQWSKALEKQLKGKRSQAQGMSSSSSSSSSEAPEANDLARVAQRVGHLGPEDPEMDKAAKVSGQGPTYEAKVAGVKVCVVNMGPHPALNV